LSQPQKELYFSFKQCQKCRFTLNNFVDSFIQTGFGKYPNHQCQRSFAELEIQASDKIPPYQEDPELLKGEMMVNECLSRMYYPSKLEQDWDKIIFKNTGFYFFKSNIF
jgi:hypothetical protein